MSHHHFTLEDRVYIQVGLEQNKSRRLVATELGCSHVAVATEISRNSVVLEIVQTTRINKPRILSLDLRSRRGRGEVPEKYLAQVRYRKRLARFARGQLTYDATIAHTLYLERRWGASQGNCIIRDDEDPLASHLAERLAGKDRNSPEQLSADLEKAGIRISHQTIYRWIERSPMKATLVKGLRRRGKRYNYAKDTQNKWNKTKDKRSIHERPSIIEELVRYGDLEGDTIVGKNPKDRLLTHADRATGVVSLSKILGYDSHKVHRQTQKDIARVFGKIHTITYDNGSEFAAWKKTEEALSREGYDVEIYFADPYRSSQRGRNENANGLVRDYFPKGTDFKQITEKELREVEKILNSRSRKRYNWRNPFEQRELVMSRVED